MEEIKMETNGVAFLSIAVNQLKRRLLVKAKMPPKKFIKFQLIFISLQNVEFISVVILFFELCRCHNLA